MSPILSGCFLNSFRIFIFIFDDIYFNSLLILPSFHFTWLSSIVSFHHIREILKFQSQPSAVLGTFWGGGVTADIEPATFGSSRQCCYQSGNFSLIERFLKKSLSIRVLSNFLLKFMQSVYVLSCSFGPIFQKPLSNSAVLVFIAFQFRSYRRF